MIRWFARLTLNQRLALLAFVLGVIAIAATPSRSGRVSVDARALAVGLQRGGDRVPARALADWIIQGRSDYRLIDVREPAAFANGLRIPSSENVPIATLLDAGLARNEKIVLVAGDETQAAQAWFLLKASGYVGVSIVDGGLAAWRDLVVYPRLSDDESPQERAKLTAMSAYFGGAPRTGAAAVPGADALPAPMAAAAPVPGSQPTLPPGGTKKPATPAKKKEGC